MGLKQIRILGFIHSWSSTSNGDSFWPTALSGSITASTWIGDSSTFLTIALENYKNTTRIQLSTQLQERRTQEARRMVISDF